MNNKEYRYTYITTGATTNVFTGRGILHNVTVNTKATGGIIRIVDNTTGTTANVGIIDSSSLGNFLYDVSISKCFIIDTGATSTEADITVSWCQ